MRTTSAPAQRRSGFETFDRGARPGPRVLRRQYAGLLVPLVLFLVSRALYAFLGFAAPQILASPGIRGNGTLLPRSDPLAAWWNWTSPWFRFDTAWYVGVAEHGYRWGSLGHANTNFMPLYPLLIRVVRPMTLGSPWIAALLIANLAGLAALVLLWRWTWLRWDQPTALRVLLLVTVFPFAFFLATPYAEPLFLALALAAFLFAEEDRWPAAIVAAGLSTVTRPVGIAVVLGLMVLAYRRAGARQALAASLAVLPLLGFILYLTLAFGRPLAFLTYHSYAWVPPHGGIVTTFESQFQTHLAPFDRIDAALVVLFLAGGVVAWRRIGPGYGVYVLAGVLLPLAHGLVSMERYVTVLFPAMAAWAQWRGRVLQGALFAVSMTLLVLFAVMFAAGYSIF